MNLGQNKKIVVFRLISSPETNRVGRDFFFKFKYHILHQNLIYIVNYSKTASKSLKKNFRVGAKR